MATREAMVVVGALLAAACAGSLEDEGGPFVPSPDDEAVDPADPPTDPDPGEDAAAEQAACAERSWILSPDGLTFVFHISKDEDHAWAAYKQLTAKAHLVRARDVFMIERKSPVVQALRDAFPCNHVHFIAYPEEIDAAYDAGHLIDGIAVDWEGGVWNNPPSWSIDKLAGYAAKFHGKGEVAGFVPYWPDSFDDAAITQAASMNYEIAQIQDRCAHDGPAAFAAAARALVDNYLAHSLKPRRLGVEISMSSYPDADNHVSVELSARCTREAYGKGARAVYLYGNGHPHLDDYLKTIAGMGLRKAP
ncbi:MAG TPA: hypothetical protein VFU21_04205 [Kofleriaceae bacterium]|nr:hypothetical protein [Kofleriaceae bacterium]